MNKDPIIEEIRRYREEHARSLDFDLKRIVEETRETEQRLREQGWTVVREKAVRRKPIGPPSVQ